MTEHAPSIAEPPPPYTMTPREIVSELDRYIVGQRDGQARGRDRAAQPLAAPAGARGAARRDRAQEHHHDRADRRRKDRDLAPARQARAGAVHQGRGLEVHRGRLRRARRRVDHPRPRRAGDRHGEGGGEGEGRSVRARELAEERVLDLLLPPPPPSTASADGRRRAPTTTRQHAREAAPHAARGQARRAHGRDRGRRKTAIADGRGADAAGHGGDGVPPEGHASPTCCPSSTKKQHGDGARGARGAHRRRKRRARSTWRPSPRRRSAASSSRASSSSTRSTRSPAARACVGPDVSREGVQRDLLPIVEGSTVNTKHGMVRTDHILFIASGAFHIAKPSDLIPEFQGRFPIRVELEPLDPRRLRPHPDRARERAASSSTSRCWRPRASRSRFADDARRRDRRIAARGERAHREHRRAPPAHGHGAAARPSSRSTRRRWPATRS